MNAANADKNCRKRGVAKDQSEGDDPILLSVADQGAARISVASCLKQSVCANQAIIDIDLRDLKRLTEKRCVHVVFCVALRPVDHRKDVEFHARKNRTSDKKLCPAGHIDAGARRVDLVLRQRNCVNFFGR